MTFVYRREVGKEVHIWYWTPRGFHKRIIKRRWGVNASLSRRAVKGGRNQKVA